MNKKRYMTPDIEKVGLRMSHGIMLDIDKDNTNVLSEPDIVLNTKEALQIVYLDEDDNEDHDLNGWPKDYDPWED